MKKRNKKIARPAFNFCCCLRTRNRGFTLIELMITVVVVAILLAIALPSYQEHLRKGRRAAAQAFLMDVASREQQYLIDARNYAVGAGALGRLSLTVPEDVSRFYTVTVEPAAAAVPPRYVVTATPLPASPQLQDGVLTLEHTGTKTRNGAPGW